MFKAVNYFKECHRRKWGSCSGVRTIPCQICFIIPSGKELPSLRFSFKQGHRLRTPGRAWQKMWMPLKETCPRESDVIFWISAQPLVSFLLIQMYWTYRKKSRNCTAIFFFSTLLHFDHWFDMACAQICSAEVQEHMDSFVPRIRILQGPILKAD